MNERTYATDAIVLRARNLGEADRILTLFTRSRGKLDAVAKGLRRQTSRFAGRLEFLTEVTATLHRGRNLDLVTSAEVIRSRWDALVAPAAFATANLLAEHVDLFCEPDLALPDVYELLRGAIEAIATSADPVTLVPRFQLRLLAALGLAPPTDVCVRCDRSIEGCEGWLDAEGGGIACERCGGARGEASILGIDDLANFAALAAPRDGERRAAVLATPRAARAIDRLVTHHLGRRPKAHGMFE